MLGRLRILALCLVGLLGVGVGFASGDDRPNIIVILADDLGYSDISPFGGDIDTPNLQRMADGGMRFRRFYNTGRCCPTRASLLTGQYPHMAGMGWMVDYDGGEKLPGYRGDLAKNTPTVGEVLGEAGYQTGLVGKWHVARTSPQEFEKGPNGNWPVERGFDRFYGTIHGAASYFDPYTLTDQNSAVDRTALPEDYYLTRAIGEESVKFVEGRDESKPLFLYMAFTAPHWPLQAPAETIAKYRGKYKRDWDEQRVERFRRQLANGGLVEGTALTAREEMVPEWSSLTEKQKDEFDLKMAIYAAMVDEMDQAIGRLLQSLEKEGILDNTLILFMGDNGACQESGLYGSAWDTYKDSSYSNEDWGSANSFVSYGHAGANVSNSPFREYKHFVHEGGVRTPMIAFWPGRAKAGSWTDTPGHLVDLMPTFLEMAGGSYPSSFVGLKTPGLPGKSLVSVLEGGNLAERPIFFEHEGNRAVMVGSMKAVSKRNLPWELYDLAVDPTETKDLAGDRPEVLNGLIEQWESWARANRVYPLTPYWSPNGLDVPSMTLKAGERKSGAESMLVHRRSFRVTCSMDELGEGVVFAHGGSTHGYAVYVKGGRVVFALRRDSRLYEVSVALSGKGGATKAAVIEAALDDGAKEIRVKVSAGGVTSSASAEIPGGLTSHPQDGMDCGLDSNGQVGGYDGEFAFTGKIGSVTVEILS